MTGQLPGLQGAIVWAVVAFQEQAPFHVTSATGDDLGTQSAAWIGHRASLPRKDAQRLQQPFRLAVDAKVRPVLILQDRPAGRLPEYAALKLTRLEKYNEATQAEIREQAPGSPFFHLGPAPQRAALDREYAIDLLSLVRIHESAIVTRRGQIVVVGRINGNEFRVVSERLIRLLDLSVADLVVRRAGELLSRQGWRRV